MDTFLVENFRYQIIASSNIYKSSGDQEQSNWGTPSDCLPFNLHHLNALLHCKTKICHFQGCQGQGENIWKTKFIPGQGKVREFCGWPGKFRKDLENQEKVREFSINGYVRLSSENLFILFKRGKDVLSHEIA